ncbi:calcium-binding protein [Ovoidimarina sediminis]|uniref:calcium-binding protein n=1 Tax=Ovoidimarina sediminis TaxID=3079856 RepID=UPI002908542D|nr:calcium-binding protein [Rhodophyticola sp. MJ-SS7]MDU8943254.1 calcium-binding protein [Rhodophyticola sp. MJ-SS7]
MSSPNVYTEAYILQNEEPWVFGADQYKTHVNDTAQQFATDHDHLRNPFEGAIGDFGLWGGFSSEDVLTAAEINDLIEFGPGDALTNPSGPEAMLVADDTFYAGGGADTVEAGAGDDTVYGEAGADTLLGGYGNDMLDGGAGNDLLDGGRGSDLLIGGDGDDILRSGSDVGEMRIGQLVIGDPSRAFPDPSVDPDYLKLVDWIDQPIVGDDVLVGGAGKDLFLFETYINAKEEIILDHVNDDRTIDWMGVAGENDRLHDHWVDGFGIDVIADYDAEEDRIAVIGHTTQVKVDYMTVDTDGDGVDDETVSVITAYSQQGKNGGAHDEDYLGYIVVHGDRVELEDIETNAGAAYGIVDTIDELQEALAPTGETAWQHDGLFGYDSRDVDGNPIEADPRAYSHNSWLQNGTVEFASSLPEGTEAPNVVLFHEGGEYTGAVTTEIAHTDAQALTSGTVAFAFTADLPGNDQNQALISKDHSG